MIEWLDDNVEKLWDDYCPWLQAVVCEIHDKSLKGHIVLQIEGIDDDFDGGWYQLDLGDCTGLSNGEINRRFCEEFKTLVDEYESYEGCCGPILDQLRDFSNEILEKC